VATQQLLFVGCELEFDVRELDEGVDLVGGGVGFSGGFFEFTVVVGRPVYANVVTAPQLKHFHVSPTFEFFGQCRFFPQLHTPI